MASTFDTSMKLSLNRLEGTGMRPADPRRFQEVLLQISKPFTHAKGKGSKAQEDRTECSPRLPSSGVSRQGV